MRCNPRFAVFPAAAFAGAILAALLVFAPKTAVAAAESPDDNPVFLAPRLHTVGGAHDITRIRLVAVYYLPPGRTAIPDWRERIAYYLDRVAKFHAREFTGQSRIEWEIRPAPFVPLLPPPPHPKDANEWFWAIANEVKESGWTRKPGDTAFPIVLVFTDTNFCPGYDEWKRDCDPKLCICPDHPRHCPGHVTRDGEERPGSACGGSRAVYWKEENMGLGVVSGDGWRVPIKGADCVAYHEGIGHAVGLPHPEPMNNSVMGTAQYEFSLNQATLDYKQKEQLGWEPKPVDRKSGLFSMLEVTRQPVAPRVGQKTAFIATVPAGTRNGEVYAEYQTAFGEWKRLPPPKRETTRDPANGERLLLTWTLPVFPRPAFVAYRIHIGKDLTGTRSSGDGSDNTRGEWWDLVRIRE